MSHKPQVLLEQAQEELDAECPGRLVKVPADGSCFFHAVRQLGGGSATVEELRQIAECGGNRWAEERNIVTLAEKLRLRIHIRVREIGTLGGMADTPWDTFVGPEEGGVMAMVLWTRGGDGVHFDGFRQESEEADALTQRLQNVRIGPEPQGKGGRLYCLVPGCPKADCKSAAGWRSMQGLRAHLQEHLAGRLAGRIPDAWLTNHNFDICSVCSSLVSSRYGGVCPRCRPMQRKGARVGGASERQIEHGMPTWAEVAEARVKTKAHVPKGSRGIWGQCLAAALAGVCEHQDERAWLELYALPKMVLRTSARGGKKKKQRKQGDRDTQQRCRKWLAGLRGELWEHTDAGAKAGAKEGSRPQVDPAAARRAKAIEMASEGLLSKACSILVAEPPVIIDDQVLDEMRRKHPQARAEDLAAQKELRQLDGSAGVELTEEQVLEAVRSFSKGSAGGPSGLLPQHLKDAMAPGVSSETLKQLTHVCNRFTSGRMHERAQPFFCGASLTALKKTDGGLRPIACGEAIRRAAMKGAWSTVKDDIKELLEPRQLGIGTPGGAEIGVHRVRAWRNQNAGDGSKGFLCLDVANAFNSVDRAAIRKAARTYFPSMGPITDLCYGAPSNVFMNDQCLSSSRGIQQGDPAGPGLFAAAIHAIICEASDRTRAKYGNELELEGWFLDDGYAGGSWRALEEWLATVETGLGAIGLRLEREKCVAVPCQIGGAAPVGLPTLAGCEWRGCGNFKLLGAAFGTREYCSALFAKRSRKASRLMTELAELGDSQAALLLLRHCASWANIMYALRTTPKELHQAEIEAFDNSIYACLEGLLGAPVDNRGMKLAELSIREGGLGLRRAARHAGAAFAASTVGGNWDWQNMEGNGGEHFRELAAQAMKELREQAPGGAFDDAGGSKGIQKRFSEILDTQDREALLSGPAGDIAFRQHAEMLRQRGAGAWLLATPGGDTAMEPELHRISVLRRLRQPIGREDAWCPLCGEILDRFSDHALTCACAGDRTIRHNRIRNLLLKIGKEAGAQVEAEKGGLLPARPEDEHLPGEGARRPADLWVKEGRSGTAYDIAVTSGLRADRLVAEGTPCQQIVEEYEDMKRGYHDTADRCKDLGFQFVPLIFEADGGGWSTKMDGMIRRLAARSPDGPAGDDADRRGANIAIRISVALHEENARAVWRRVGDGSLDDDKDATEISLGLAGAEGLDMDEGRENGLGGSGDWACNAKNPQGDMQPTAATTREQLGQGRSQEMRWQ